MSPTITHRFTYILSTSWNKPVNSVIFNISRYGKHTHRIDFPEPVSFADAVIEVQRFLCAPIDNDYYDRVKDDLFHNIRHFYIIRGDCLGDCKFLERVREVEPGVVKFWCGS